MGEHHSAAWENIADPVVFLAAAGERTKHIRLGSGVVSLPYYNPLLVADRFVQLDYMTNGRAMLGAGPGALISDAMMMGVDPVTQRPRMDEALGVIIRLLRGEVVTHVADWFELHDARLQLLPLQRYHADRRRQHDVAVGDGGRGQARRGRAVARCRPRRRPRRTSRRSGRWARSRPPPTARCCGVRSGAS